MKTCPKCGAEVADDNKYCYRCGSPLDGPDMDHVQQPQTEPSHAEPVRAAAVPRNGKRSSNFTVYALIAVLLAIAVVSVAMLPSLFVPSSEYNVTVTIESASITDKAKMYETDSSGCVLTSFTFGYGNGSATNSFAFSKDTFGDVSFKCKTDGTSSTFNISKTFRINAEPKNFVFSLFYNVHATHGDKTITDYVDIYTEKFKDGSSKPDYIGYSGILFNLADLDNDGKVTFTGDSDPIGSVSLKITYQKV